MEVSSFLPGYLVQEYGDRTELDQGNMERALRGQEV